MEARWLDLCRSCLSPETEVSLFDSEQNLKEKFLQVTTVQVSLDDGLPQKLCNNCYTVMETAYQFRNQCITTDSELKEQLKALLEKSGTFSFQPIENETDTITDNDFANDPVKQLEAIIKQEPSNDDDDNDDCYYVLVIDDPKEKESEIDLKVEKTGTEDETLVNLPHLDQDNIMTTNFEESIDSFLVKDANKVPDNVPATILENEETQDSEDNFDQHMDIDEAPENQNSNTQDSMQPTEDSQDNFDGEIIETLTDDLNTIGKKNLIKILSASNGKTYVLKDENGIQYVTDAQIITNEEGNSVDGDEVILYDDDGEDSSQLQNKDEGYELIIEYADDGQISTVVQQEDGSFYCGCGETFEDLAEYEKHTVKHNPLGDNLCNVCGKGFESPEILKGHTLLHSVSGLLVQCPFCNQLLKRNILTQHIKFSHNNIKPKCDVCGKTFANPNNLKRHMVIHTGIREFECDICHKSFHQKITMQTHRLIHINPFACNQCEFTFDNAEELNQHKESGECSKSKVEKVKEELMKTIKQLVTTNVGKVLGYACSICKKMFSVESALEQHIETNHILDPNELLCSECGEVMSNKKEMQSHILTHKSVKQKNAKRFECSVCNKGCSSQAMLLMHERVHTNERPFPCQLCALRFKTKTHLRTHQLTHTREKKYGCPVCGKFFALKGNLVVHLRTHTGERPYVCSICNESFIDSKYLKKHKLRKHDIFNVPWNKY